MDTLYRASIEDREKLRVREREREREKVDSRSSHWLESRSISLLKAFSLSLSFSRLFAEKRSNPARTKIDDRRVSETFFFSFLFSYSTASLSILLSRPATYPVSADPSTVGRESLFAFIEGEARRGRRN